jgi:hypothetical protein
MSKNDATKTADNSNFTLVPIMEVKGCSFQLMVPKDSKDTSSGVYHIGQPHRTLDNGINRAHSDPISRTVETVDFKTIPHKRTARIMPISDVMTGYVRDNNTSEGKRTMY